MVKMQNSPERADYGFDAPTTVRNFILIGLGLIAIGFLTDRAVFALPAALSFLDMSSFVSAGACFIATAVWMILGSRVFKYRTRDKLIGKLDLKGSEQTLDVGCGRGLLLIGTAKKLNSGRAFGIDIWQTVDQSGNDPKVTPKNAELEGVVSKIEIVTGDARKLPFQNNQFDRITSSWAIHNIPTQEGRDTSLSEMIRVLKPGGKIVFLDIKYGYHYNKFLKNRVDINFEKLGPDLTFLTPGHLFVICKP
jgi:arsenite methyltransferase